jgi:hypothetical protein
MPIKIKSTGGGSVSIDVPNTGSDFALTAPAISGNIITSGDTATITQAMLGANSVIQSKLANGIASTGPAFSVYRNTTQTIPHNTFTRVNFEIEEFDTANCYDNTTNFRFTPNVAGYYQISLHLSISLSGTNASTFIAAIAKNGSVTSQNYITYRDITNTYSAHTTKLIYMNGTTDYIDGQIYHNQGADRVLAVNQTFCYMSGFLARAA